MVFGSSARRGTYPLKTEDSIELFAQAGFDPPNITATRCEFGWPLLAMKWHEVGSHPKRFEARGWWVDLPGPWLAEAIGFDLPRRLPLEPVWLGLIGNTAIYGGVLAVGMWLVVGARRAARRRRGWCAMCAYDLRGEVASGCSECGWGK